MTTNNGRPRPMAFHIDALLTQAKSRIAAALLRGDQAAAARHQKLYDSVKPLAVKYAQAKL